MKKYISLIIILLFPFMVLALDEEEIKNYEQDIVEAYEETVNNNDESNNNEEIDSSNDYSDEESNEQTENVLDDDVVQTDDNYKYLNEETGYKVVIEDDAHLLNENQINQLIDQMQPLTKYGHIAFKSISTNDEFSTDYYASNYYHNKFGTKSGTLFLIDMDKRIIYIFSDGANYDVITSSKAEIITDNIYTKATLKLYYECASEAYKEIYDLLEGRKITEPMRHITNALISITIGFFGTFLFMINKTKIPEATPKQRLKYSKINFDMGEVSVKKTGTSKRYNPPSSSSDSGGGGFSGGGGGGGSSGGGGGHSF